MLGRFAAQFRRWDRPAQAAFALALLLLCVVLAAGALGGDTLRQPALIGAFGLFIMLQIIIMWANRGMVSDYTRAQRHFLNEDFEQARDLLEARRERGSADWRELTLLGNTYRQLGQIDASKAVLSEALNIRPEHHFPLYGFGRTLLVEGQYSEAARQMQQALDAGAPPPVQIDVAEAWYRAGQHEQTRAALQAVDLAADPPRALMAAYLRQRLDDAPAPSAEQIEAGLPHWQALAARFRQTAYGQALLEDVRRMTGS
jgi:tetratricopeptide (TPR) repeat protein